MGKGKKINLIIVLIAMSVYYIWCCNLIMIELPHLTWFTQLPLAEKFFSNNLGISDLLSRYGEHGMFANNVLFIINVKIFHGTTMFDVYINDINVIACGCIIAYLMVKSLENNQNRHIILWITLPLFFMFDCMQMSAGAMETQVRLGIAGFIIAMSLVDYQLREDNNAKASSFIWTLIAIIFSINVVGTLYSFAGVPLVWLIVSFYTLRMKKMTKKRFIIALEYLFSIPLYLIEYRISFPQNMGGESGILNMLCHPIDMVKSFAAWCANGVLSWAYYDNSYTNNGTYLLVGMIMTMAVLMAVYLFFEKKMYEKTWMPLMLIVYSVGVWFMVCIGRSYEWQWMASEWYNAHIRLMYAGTIWIYVYALQVSDEKHKKNILVQIGTIAVMFSGVIGTCFYLYRAPYVKAYYQEKQPYLYIQTKEDMPVDEGGNTPLLAPLDATMNSINILKKYNLSVYRYWNSYEKSLDIVENNAHNQND